MALQYQRPVLYPKQLAAIFHNERYGIIEASTKAGKTVACIVWLIEQAIQGSPGNVFWWVAPSYNQAKIAYTRLKNMATAGGIAATNETDLIITLTNGAAIWFKSGELPDKLYGEDVHAAVVDEATRVREEAWHAVRSTLTATRGPIRIIGNVKGRKNWVYDLAREAEKGSPNMHYAKLVAYDAVEAGVLAADEIEDAKRRLPESVFKELYLAEPSDDGSNPFGAVAIDTCVIPELSHLSSTCWGWDLAKSSDWTVGIALDGRGHVCRFHRWQRSWRDTISLIVELCGNVPTLVDATGAGDPVLEYLQKDSGAGNIRGFKFSASSKQQLMEGLSVGIQQHELGLPRGGFGRGVLVPTDPGHLIMELHSFEYEHTRTGVRYCAPQGKHDDCVCALALAWKQFRKPEAPAWVQAAKRWVPPAVLPIFGR